MKGRKPWIIGGILLASLAGAVIYFAFVRRGAINPPDGGPVQIDQDKQDQPKNVPPEAAKPPDYAPLAFADAAKPLYTGVQASQRGFKKGSLDAKRVAVLRGRVYDRDGKPLADVDVRVAGHPEYGETRTSANGAFDLAVNGGGGLCIDYRKEGFLPVCRNIAVPWQDYTWLPDVVLCPQDAAATEVDLKSAAPIQVARASTVKDGNGERRATLLIPNGTTAIMVLANGTKKSLTRLKLRATEYTVGETGPQAMPAPLPPNSGYTYAVELNADEAVASGAKEVRFNQPLIHYVENFLRFPAGAPVPTGYFDREKNSWIPAESGVVIEIASVTDGLANLIVSENREIANAAALSRFDITKAERHQLGSLYEPGQSLWRVRIPHFSTWDCNWGFSPPGDAENPDADADGDPDGAQCDIAGASVIGIQRQILGESVPLSGTRFRLHYQSNRTEGCRAPRSLRIKLSGAQVPKSLKRIELEVQIAGQRFSQNFPGKADQSYLFVWDGKDGHGRPVAGGHWAAIKVGYVYDGVYERSQRFGDSGNGALITGSRTRQEVALWREFRKWMGGWDARTQGLGGWTVNVHHFYDVAGRTLHLGDGRQQGGTSSGLHALNQNIMTVAGGGQAEKLGDDGPALEAHLEDPARGPGAGFARNRIPGQPWGLAIGPSGETYVSDESGRIRLVASDGQIRTVAGGGTKDPAKGGKASEVRLPRPLGLAVAPDGRLLIAAPNDHRIYQLDRNGDISVVAGSGKEGYSGDGAPALRASLKTPQGVVCAPDGSVFITDTGNHCVRRVGPDGLISTWAGDGKRGFGGDGGPALRARLYGPTGLALASNGSLYVADTGNYVIRRISPTGTISTVVGTPLPDYKGDYAGDSGPATKAKLNEPTAIALSSDGILLIADTNNHRVRHVGLDGTITTVAGTTVADRGRGDFGGDGGPANQARLSFPAGLAVAPDGSFSIYDGTRYISGTRGRSRAVRHRIRRVSPALPGFTNEQVAVPSKNGSELFKFDATGRHLETRDALTGALRYRFRYDTAGRLIGIEDAFGNTCTIKRHANGNPQAVIAPYGQQTALEVNQRGYLEKVAPAGDTPIELAYDPHGLLTSSRDGRGMVSRFAYDDLGRLVRDEGPAGGLFALKRRELPDGIEVSVTTALKPPTKYRSQNLPGGASEFVNQCCCGSETTVRGSPDGVVTTNFPDGTIATRTEKGDPRWGGMVRNTVNAILQTPRGRKASAVVEHTATLADRTNPLSLKSQTSALTLNGRKYSRTFDAASRTITQTTPAGRQRVTTLDERGRIVQRQSADLVPVRLKYDEKGRLSELVQGDGNAARRVVIEYDEAGRIVAVTDPLKRTLGIHYDNADRPNRQVLPDGREIGLSFDARGNLLSLTPPGKTAHMFQYSPVNLLTAYDPPKVESGASRTSYEFDKDGKLTRILHPDKKAVELVYDRVGHLQMLTIPGDQRRWTFDDKTEQIKTVAGPDGSLSFAYDGFLPTQTTWAGAVQGAVSRQYDNDFRVIAESVNHQAPDRFAYDPDGLLIAAGALQLQRDPKTGFITDTRLGTVSTSTGYNPFGEAIRFEAKVGGKDMLTIKYERDVLGRITRKTETLDGKTDVFSYAYDGAGRLTDVTRNHQKVGHYEYDSNGNRLNYEGPLGRFSGAYDAEDRVTSYGPASFTHTAAGQWLTRTENGKITRYNYDLLGNLRAVDLPDGTKIEYLVDPANRRVGKKVNGKLVQGFLWQGRLRILAELDGGNRLVSRFIYGTRINVPEYMVKAGKTYRIITNHLGSPRLVVEVTSGEIVQRMKYDEFGKVLKDTNPGFQPFGFAGGIYDAQTQLTRFGVRDYEAEGGRWLAKDGYGFFRGTNLYTYAAQDPINKKDAFGLYDSSDFMDDLGGVEDVASNASKSILGFGGRLFEGSHPIEAGAAAVTVGVAHIGAAAILASEVGGLALGAVGEAGLIGGVTMVGAAGGLAAVGLGMAFLGGMLIGEGIGDILFGPDGESGGDSPSDCASGRGQYSRGPFIPGPHSRAYP